ncbi:MAG: hypothetical protein H0W86_11920 [Armatimonadetes bacterium]|nr:hypothetical protein [Armatimonadota bacterium]
MTFRIGRFVLANVILAWVGMVIACGGGGKGKGNGGGIVNSNEPSKSVQIPKATLPQVQPSSANEDDDDQNDQKLIKTLAIARDEALAKLEKVKARNQRLSLTFEQDLEKYKKEIARFKAESDVYRVVRINYLSLIKLDSAKEIKSDFAKSFLYQKIVAEFPGTDGAAESLSRLKGSVSKKIVVPPEPVEPRKSNVAALGPPRYESEPRIPEVPTLAELRNRRLASNTEITSRTIEYIPGLVAVDVHGNFTNKGFTLTKINELDQHLWTCVKEDEVRRMSVDALGASTTKIASVRGFYVDKSDGDADQLAKDFLGYVASIPYEGAEPNRAKEWVRTNVGSNSTVTIGGVSFELVARVPHVRVLIIQRKSN